MLPRQSRPELPNFRLYPRPSLSAHGISINSEQEIVNIRSCAPAGPRMRPISRRASSSAPPDLTDNYDDKNELDFNRALSPVRDPNDESFWESKVQRILTAAFPGETRIRAEDLLGLGDGDDENSTDALRELEARRLR